MALAAVRALKAVTGLPILVCTSLDFIDLIRLSPSVDFGANTMEEIEAVLAQGKMMKPLIVDWGALRFATSRFHQVDAYLLDLGLTLPDIDKGLEIVLPHDVEVAPVHDILNAEAAGKLLVILHAASNHRNRIWSGEFWLDLSRRLLDEGYAVIVIGNTHRGDDRAALLSVPGVINLMDRFDHAGTIGLLRRCHILISNDADFDPTCWCLRHHDHRSLFGCRRLQPPTLSAWFDQLQISVRLASLRVSPLLSRDCRSNGVNTVLRSIRHRRR